MTIRVLVADDQAMIRGALAGLLDLESDIEVVAQAADGAQALEELARLASADAPARASAPVNVAIIDIEMPRMDGITATQAIRSRFPGVRVLIVTTFGRPGYLQRALDAGAMASWSRMRRSKPWPTEYVRWPRGAAPLTNPWP